MMKYEVIWHDADDDRTGNSFVVEAESPSIAYQLAGKKIRS